uniref:AAA+ ATPase domain-containing protein n=1 Tax=viral metagenome TaxID=1070528 RepID=A0A6C0ER75_9ZZZZ
MEFSREQQFAFDKYIRGHNIFITGPGGSGKSELIKRINQHAYHQGKNIYVTALTGCAAVLLNCKAKTLHSWSGIGLGNGSCEQLITKIKKNKFAKAIWKETDILIVDEVSMLSLKLFNILNEIGKAVRGNFKPFGGIQLIFSGDFYQLPPVGNKDEPDTMRFCFESDDWNSVFHRDCQIQLVKIFRQTDEIYSNILNQIREGKIKRKSNDLLLQYVGRELDPKLVAEPTKLYPTKNKVEGINIGKMASLSGEEKEFKLKYLKDIEMTKNERVLRSEFSEKDIQIELDFLASNLICEKEMKLKIGAQVMCIVNIQSDRGIEVCNGSQGIIVGFCTVTCCPRVKYNNGIEMVMMRHLWASDKIPGIGVSQVPLILAWALTIHKSQGATLDTAEIDVGSGIFECGQTYVALSRVKSLDGLYLTSFDAKRIRINKKVKEFYESLTTYMNDTEVYIPLVIAEPIQNAIHVPIDSNSNPFIDYQYVEAVALPELSEEKIDD